MRTAANEAAARHEANLVWSRYNAMVVAATVGVGLLGQVVDKPELAVLGLAGSVFGVVGTIFWWLITSFGWSLSHVLLPTDTDYFWWRWKYRGIPQDPIWLCAHGVIWLYYWGYVAFGVWYLVNLRPGLAPIVGGLLSCLFLFLLWFSLKRLSLFPTKTTDGSADGALTNKPLELSSASAERRVATPKER